MRFSLGRVGLAFAAAILAVAGPARAQPPATPVRLSLAYDGRLIIKVLDIHFDEQATPTGFGAAASLRSYGILAAFKTFDVKASARGRIEDGAPRPGQFLYDNRDGKRERKVQVVWRQGEVAMTSTPVFSNLGQPPASLEQKLASADPLTQLMRIALAPTPAGVCTGAPRFFDGKQLYALEFEHGQTIAVGPSQRALGVTSLVRCDVHYREIAGFKPKPPEKRNQGLKSQISVAFGQLGAGGPWVIERISADTVLGPAVIELKHVQMSRDVSPPQD
ncbi:MAG: hypothetical protein P4L73_19810 [Caulobacteraceae bacterium]|nr:hypothetical protein [Caulobacteraceae bacterium]